MWETFLIIKENSKKIDLTTRCQQLIGFLPLSFWKRYKWLKRIVCWESHVGLGILIMWCLGWNMIRLLLVEGMDFVNLERCMLLCWGGSAPCHRWLVPIKGDHAQTGSQHNEISLRWNVNVLCNVPNQRNRC